MVLPALLIYGALALYPIVESVHISLFDWNGLGPMTKFVGLQNYVQLLTKAPFDARFFGALSHNLFVLLFGSATLNVAALGLALILWTRRGRVYGALRLLYLAPWAVSPVIVAALWALLLHPQFGALAATFHLVGLPQLDLPWLGDPTLALPVVILIGNWQVLGFNVLIYLAALDAIPAEITEVARIDGASTIRLVRSIVLPLLRPVMLTLAILAIVFSFNYFETVFLLEGPQAGPNYATDVLGTLTYRTAFGGQYGSATSFGAAAALAVVTVLAVVPASLLLIRLRRRFDVQY